MYAESACIYHIALSLGGFFCGVWFIYDMRF